MPKAKQLAVSCDCPELSPVSAVISPSCTFVTAAGTSGALLRSCPNPPLCGHPRQGILGEQNQSLATRVEVGFLGSLGPVEVSLLRLLNSLEQDFS